MKKNLRAEGVQIGKGGGALIPTQFKLEETCVALLFYFPSTPPTL